MPLFVCVLLVTFDKEVSMGKYGYGSVIKFFLKRARSLTVSGAKPIFVFDRDSNLAKAFAAKSFSSKRVETAEAFNNSEK